jgi:hypothetical protein
MQGTVAVGLVEGTEKCGGRVVLVAEVVSEVVNEVVEKLEAVLVGSAVSVVGGEDRFVTRRLGLLGSR